MKPGVDKPITTIALWCTDITKMIVLQYKINPQ